MDAGHARGFAFYAAKDAEMAREADVGLVIWDSKSPGSLKQVERMASAGKTVVVYVNPERRFVDIKGQASWARFVSTLPSVVRSRMGAKPNPPTITHRQSGLF